MPANPPISVYIRAKNEERMIREVIRAAFQIGDEVLVIDSGSSDRTIEITEAEGARVIRESWHGWGKQKRIGEEAARHDWLFDLDADEIITPELAAQELVTRESTGVTYWEGACRVRGTRDGAAVAGYGYVELTGYAAAFRARM